MEMQMLEALLSCSPSLPRVWSTTEDTEGFICDLRLMRCAVRVVS